METHGGEDQVSILLLRKCPFLRDGPCVDSSVGKQLTQVKLTSPFPKMSVPGTRWSQTLFFLEIEDIQVENSKATDTILCSLRRQPGCSKRE